MQLCMHNYLQFCAFFTASLEVLENVEVEYLTFPGWQCVTSGCRKFNDLPPNAKAYVLKIQEILQVPGNCYLWSYNVMITDAMCFR